MMNLGKQCAHRQTLSHRYGFVLCLFLSLSFFSVLSLSGQIQAGSLTAEVDRDVVPVGETFILQINWNATVSSQSPEPAKKFDPSFKMISGPSIQSSTTYINGKKSAKTSWAWEIQATKAGQFTLPRFKLGGQHTTALRLNIIAAQTADSPDFQDVMVSIEADKDTALVGEQIILTYKIFARTRYRATEQPKVIDLPSSFDEQVMEPHSGKQSVSTIKGQPYQVVEYRQTVYGTEAGTFELDPFILKGRYRSTRGNNRRNQPFEIKSKKISLTIKPLDSKALKAKKIQQAQIPVTKQLQLSTQWAIPDGPIDIGEPIILEVHMSAPAQITSRLPDIKIPSSSALKIYSDGEESRQDTSWNDGITGYRTQRFAIIPQKAGSFTIPSTKIAWWNTKTNTLDFSEITGQKINVTSGVADNKQGKPSSNSDIELGLNPGADADFEAELLAGTDDFEQSLGNQSNNKKNRGAGEGTENEDTEFWRNASLFMGAVWLFTIGYLIQTRGSAPKKKASESSTAQEGTDHASSTAHLTKAPSKEQQEKKRLFRKKVQLDIVPILELHHHDVPPQEACLRLIKALCAWASKESPKKPQNVTQLLACIEPDDHWQPLLKECEAYLYNPSEDKEWPKEAIRKALIQGLPALIPEIKTGTQINQGLAPLVP